MSTSRESRPAIRFEDKLLPGWSLTLDLAAALAPVSEEVRCWFSRFTTGSGVDDARTVAAHCRSLRASILHQRDSLAAELQHRPGDPQSRLMIGAWLYALDTMIQAAEGRPVCTWSVEQNPGTPVNQSDDGDVDLRRL